MYEVLIQTEAIDVAAALARADDLCDNCGAVVSFVGKVRGRDHDQPLSHLWLTHLPGATEAEVGRIIQAASQRWALAYSQVIHRVGHINVGEPIVLVLTTSAHRDDAYQANRFIMDYLKTEAPFWKKECFVDGRAHWVDMKTSDVAHTQQWQQHD